MDGLIEDAGGHVEAVELEKTGILQQDDVDEHGHDPLGVNRAAGHVDHGRVDADLTQVLLDAHGVRRIRMSGEPTTVDRARTDGDNRVRAAGGVLKRNGSNLAGHAQRIAVPALLNRALVHKNVVARFDGLVLGLLHRVTCSRRQGLRVVQRDHVENDRSHIGGLNLCERLRASRAGSTLDPNNRIKVALRCSNHGFHSLRNARSSELGQTGSCRHGAAKLHEAATRYTARRQDAVKLRNRSLVFHVHTSSRCPRPIRWKSFSISLKTL